MAKDKVKDSVGQGDEVVCPICTTKYSVQVRYQNGKVLLPSFCLECGYEFDWDNGDGEDE